MRILPRSCYRLLSTKTHHNQSIIHHDKVLLKDHREIGSLQNLFLFHKASPGNPFFLPNGTKIFNTLINLIKYQYLKHHYEEVISPLLYKQELWIKSGHFMHFKSNMYKVTSTYQESDNDFYLKPMHCPGHCLIYKSVPRAYTQLPIRLAEFSPLHRNEASGALTGLTRVRRFHQDDAHIFCTQQQTQTEIRNTLEMIDRVYSLFGFESWTFELSTRPDTYLGTLAQWDSAEQALRTALKEYTFTENVGDGAFYGPKIDVYICDANGKKHQTATVQLDFQLPEKFDLQYSNADNSISRPVLIHRAILGSIERMLAILSDHYQGKWPFWLNPKQVMIIPIHNGNDLNQYVKHVQSVLQGTDHVDCSAKKSTWYNAVRPHLPGRYRIQNRMHVYADLGTDTVADKIRNAIVQGFGYIAVVGDRELANKTVNLRSGFSTPLALAEQQFAQLDLFPQAGMYSKVVELSDLIDYFYLIQTEFVSNRLRAHK